MREAGDTELVRLCAVLRMTDAAAAPATENEADDEDEIETIHDSTIVVIDSAAVNSDSATLIDNGDE